MRVKIKNKQVVAKGTLRIDFSTDPGLIDFKPGQHGTFILIDPAETDAEGDWRIFSFINPPGDKQSVSITTRLRDTAFKRVLKDLPPGSEVELESIRGNFILPESTDRPLVFIAGGIGITPFLSMLQYLDEQKLLYQVTLIYANRDRESTAYFDLLREIVKRNKNIKIIFTMTQDPDWPGEKRHIDQKFLKDYFSNPDSNTYYVAGPPAMVKTVYKALTDSGINSSNIKSENFTGY